MSGEHIDQLIETCQQHFNLRISEFRSEVTLFLIHPQDVLHAVKLLRDAFGYNLLVDETAVDYGLQAEPRFHVLYQLRSMETKNVQDMLRLRVPVSGESPLLDSIAGLFPNANWFEREIWDMFGIRFNNHPDPRRILMPSEWEGHPLRKDYPLGYEEPQFTFNFEEINQRKHYSRE